MESSKSSMREAIISLLSEKSTMSLDINSIAKKLQIKNQSSLQKELNGLVSEGILDYSPKKNKYLLFENSHLVKTRIAIDKMGNGIAKVDGKVITILKKNLRGASYNDLVALSLDEANNYGIVSRIIERDNSNYVGEVITKNNKLYIKDKRLGLITVNNNNLVEGQKVLMHHENGKIQIVDIIGHKDDPGVDIKAILYDHGFDDTYNDDVIAELKNIPSYLSAT